MTYSLFLLIFLGTPIALLGWLLRGRLQRRHLLWIGTLMSVALVYTTPWDNYLVASRVWWYDPELVLGITIGWVPIEEYTFFLLQPIMVGLWVIYVAHHVPEPPRIVDRPGLRTRVTVALGLLWAVALVTLIWGWQPGTYLALILVWALPPIGLQAMFGADILGKEWRLVLAGILPPVVYLCLADALAIQSGTWTISPSRSLEIYLGSVLPVEEFAFFVVTNVLIVFSVVLLRSKESHARLAAKFGDSSFFRSSRSLSH